MVAPFSRLHVENGIDVYLTQADTQSLHVEVDGYDLEDVVSAVENGELRLSRKGRWGGGSFRRSHISAYLQFVQLSAIEAAGGSDVISREELQLERLSVGVSGGSDVDLSVQAESLEFTASGGSDLRLRGQTDVLAIEASGGSDVAARSLQARRVEASLSGGSDASFAATEAVAIDASGGSDVTVFGDPAERAVRNDRSSDVSWR